MRLMTCCRPGIACTRRLGAALERQLSKMITRSGRVDLLCLDELGYIEPDRRGAELSSRS